MTFKISSEKIEKFIEKQHSIDGMVSMHDFELWLEEQPRVGEWIPVSERLPDCYEPVLAIAWDEVENGWYYYVAIYHDEDGFITDSIYVELNFEEPFAWMPLPEPYKEGSDE